jgi:hypothetical protein
MGSQRLVGKKARLFQHLRSGAGRDLRGRPNVATVKFPGVALATARRTLCGWARIVGQ